MELWTGSGQDGTGVPSYGIEDSIFNLASCYARESATRAGVLHRQPGTVLLAAGDALLNE